MRTFKLNANGGQFTGDHTLVMADVDGVPTPIGIIEAVGFQRDRNAAVKAYFLYDGFMPNDQTFKSKAAAERAIVEHFSA